jgi:transcriptional regulator with XRE-family HTH domain
MARRPRTYQREETQLLERIAERVHVARRAAGISQEELAHRAHLSRSHISKIENAQYDPQITTLLRIARAFNLDLEHFMSASHCDPEPQQST